jgi:hypothetical protein
MCKLNNEVVELSEDALEAIAGGLKFELKDVAISSISISAPHGNVPVEQALRIGSQSTGAGAGKVSFNPF